jgi:hypothetical protein
MHKFSNEESAGHSTSGRLLIPQSHEIAAFINGAKAGTSASCSANRGGQ